MPMTISPTLALLVRVVKIPLHDACSFTGCYADEDGKNLVYFLDMLETSYVSCSKMKNKRDRDVILDTALHLPFRYKNSCQKSAVGNEVNARL